MLQESGILGNSRPKGAGISEGNATVSDPKLLFAVLSPRDIPRVIMSLQDAPFDQYWVRFYPSRQAYKIARDYFLAHAEYTHLVIWTDDLVYDHEQFMKLARLAGRTEEHVICGVANVDRDALKDYLTITKNLPALDKGRRQYAWYHKDAVQGIFYVQHSGLTPGILDRAAAYWYPFYRGDETGNNQDVMLSHSVAEGGGHILCNADARFLHLRHAAEIKNGHVPAYTELKRAG